MNWYSNIKTAGYDKEDIAYLTRQYGSIEAFQAKVEAIKNIIGSLGLDIGGEASELTSDRTPAQILKWLEYNNKVGKGALKLYEAVGATSPNDKVWSDIDVFGKAWDGLF